MPYKTLEQTRAYEKSYRERHAATIKEYQTKYRELNKDQAKEYKKAWYVNNKARRYGLTVEQLAALIDKQDHKCGICSTSFEEVRMYIDHNHSTGMVRGLLCMNCNTGIGHLKDSKEILKKAIEYLND